MRPNSKVSDIALSRTIALDTRAKELIAAGRDVLNLTAGEPDFDAPAAVRAAARAAIDGGDVRYTPAPGRAVLRAAIARHLTATRGVEVDPEEVVVCHSAKHALSGALLTLLEPGDELLLLLPAWVSYFEQARFAGARPIGVPPRADLGPDLDAIRAAITPRTRGILLNSPCNPSGYCLTPDEVRALGELALERDLWLVSDEIYRRLAYDDAPQLSPLSVSPQVRARTVLVDGASKAYAMTGYRIGFLAAPPAVAAGVARLHSQLTGSPNAISQDAFLAALEEEPPEVAAMAAEFDRRRTLLLAGLERIDLPAPRPRGAFYVFPSIAHLARTGGSDAFCEALLEEEGLALVPGSAFGMDEHVRISYAAAEKTLRAAIERLGRFLSRAPRVA